MSEPSGFRQDSSPTQPGHPGVPSAPTTPERPGTTPLAPRRSRLPRIPGQRSGRDLVAGATALIVVVLFIALFGALAVHGRAGPGSSLPGTPTVSASTTGTTTSDATPTKTAYTTAAGALTYLANSDTRGEPVVSESDPSVVYYFDGQNITRKSNDATSQLSLPPMLSNAAGFNWVDLAVSPLSSDTIFVTASMLDSTGNYLAGGCPVSLPTALVTPLGGNRVASPASGRVPCQVQFVTSDGGQHWQILHLPQNLLLGNASAFNGQSIYSAPPVVVGNRQLFDVSGVGPLGVDLPHVLVTSANGGVTWEAASVPFPSGWQACSVASPQGSTVLYVFAVSRGCSSNYQEYDGQQEGIWRSPDGGATWTQVTAPSTDYVETIAVGGPHEMLYALSGRGQDHTTPLTQSQDIWISTDQGKTWTDGPWGPQAGLPDSANWLGTLSDGAGPVPTVLSDGTLVLPFAESGESNPALWALQPGAKAWKQVAALPDANPYIEAATPTYTADGHLVLYLVLSTEMPNAYAYYNLYTFAF